MDIHEGFGPQEETSEKPPSNYDEFLKAEGISDWPFPMSLEQPLDIQSEGLFMGTQENIFNILKASAPLGLHMLEEMEKRLDELDNTLYYFTNQVLTDDKRISRLAEGLFHSPSKTFLTDGSEPSSVKSNRHSLVNKSIGLVDTMMESRKRSLEYYQFPGFVQGELIELPSQLEAPPILHRITTAQNFNPGFRKFWKKVFLSEASSAILQDTFWWIFLDKFNKEEGLQEDKDFLFDRIADSYVALFTSINADVKDKFLSVYPNCLAQALYCTYRNAFPESKWKFNDEFKQYLVNLIYELVTGLRPTPGVWKTWNEESLEQNKTFRENETAKVLEAAGLHQKELNLDMDGFSKVIDKLGAETAVQQQGQIIRETTKLTGQSNVKAHLESHQVGPGPEYERVKFNTSGRSPLIAHYLHMRQLRDYKQPGMKVRRTEILKLPPEGPTYQEFIAETLSKADALNKEYSRVCEKTEAEILDLNRKQRDTNHQINKVKRAFNDAKTLQERQNLIDKLYEEMNSKELTPSGPTARSDSRLSDEPEDI
ncbi:unnamed protein product [Lymnaea stagnalis]|uniref:Protein FAM227B n=1 Tax=Lymnaea stagnalis TaxID=6523 RepID=A0AAV2GZ50_LYMST